MVKSKRKRWTGHVTLMSEKRNTYRVLLGKQKGNRQLERLRRRWENNIIIYVRELGWGRLWIEISGGHL
jgi:hypothetical protein